MNGISGNKACERTSHVLMVAFMPQRTASLHVFEGWRMRGMQLLDWEPFNEGLSLLSLMI